MSSVPDRESRTKTHSDHSNLAYQLPTETPSCEVEVCSSSDQSISGVTDVSPVTPNCAAGVGATSVESSPVTAVTKPVIGERPCYRVFDEEIRLEGKLYRSGVWFFGTKEEKRESIEVEYWVCAPLHIDALTRDGQSNNFGRLLRFRPTIGPWRSWAMPMELLAGDARELRAELLNMGLEIDPKAKNALPLYLQSTVPDLVMYCATQVGWSEGSFVLPDVVIGPDSGRVIFQSGARQIGEFVQRGTIDGWREHIAKPAEGNPILALALSAGFAGPLLRLCHAESGGLHLVGDSSTGKTAALEAACSIWGGREYKRSWRATSNGMEGAAAMFNDCLLALDEISECDPREVGAIVYSLGNGHGKQRANRTGGARNTVRFNTMVLSNGERSLATAMLEGGYRAKAGQGVRLMDIPINRRYGAWDDLHGLPDGASFSDRLKTAAAVDCGLAGLVFVESLAHDGRDFCALLEKFKQLPHFATEDGQQKRAASRLALIAMAGELATEYGVTGWSEGESIEACSMALKAWRTLRGAGPDERRQVLQQVSDFIERHGDGRFSDDTASGLSTRDRAGWWREKSGTRIYLFTSEGMREALKGHDFQRALDHLQNAGALIDCSKNERAKTHRIAGRGALRLYSIDPDQLEVRHGS